MTTSINLTFAIVGGYASVFLLTIKRGYHSLKKHCLGRHRKRYGKTALLIMDFHENNNFLYMFVYLQSQITVCANERIQKKKKKQ